MVLENITLIRYRDDLCKIETHSPKGTKLIIDNGNEALVKCIETVLEGAVPKEWEDIHLEGILATGGAASLLIEEPVNITAIVYPYPGEVDEWKLNNGNFFSNFHANPDPLIVMDIKRGIHFHPEVTDEYLWWRGNNTSQNSIRGALFFKTNPFSDPSRYDGFQEFLDYKIKT